MQTTFTVGPLQGSEHVNFFFPLVNKGAIRITRPISRCAHAHMGMHKFAFLREDFMCMPMSLKSIGPCSLKAQQT